jgi:hypothetical protein
VLEAFERSVFEFAKPSIVVITTPNAEYNAVFENLADGKFRHPDHRFEWDRKQFSDWVKHVCESHGYTAEIQGIGLSHESYGSPTQMAVFRKH